MLINQKEGQRLGDPSRWFYLQGNKIHPKITERKGHWTGPVTGEGLEHTLKTQGSEGTRSLGTGGRGSPPLRLALISAGLNLLCFFASFLPPAVETSCGEKHSCLLVSFTGSRILSPSKCPSVPEKFSLVAWVTWQPIGPITNARGMGYCGSLNLGTLSMT